MRATLLIVALMLSTVSRGADLSAEQDARYRGLIAELRCLVCQNQSIADSNAPLAADLRDQVSSQIVAGKSDREILDYLTARYGDFVLYRPPVKSNTLLLWLAPGVLVIAGIVMALRIARRRAVPTPVTIDESKLQQILRETERKP